MFRSPGPLDRAAAAPGCSLEAGRPTPPGP